MQRGGAEDGAEGASAPPSGEGPERRRAFRRKLPFGRGAILQVGERSHIVGVADLSVTGAYLTTRAPVTAGETHLLKLLVLPERLELVMRAEVVRVSLTAHESTDHPRGVAVRFVEVDNETGRRLQSFVTRGARPA